MLIVPESHTGLEPAPPPGLERLEPVVRELLRVSHTSSELNMVAWHYALRRQPEIGLNFVERALTKDAGCIGCLDTRALLLYQLGRPVEALADQERAAHLLSDEGVPKRMKQRLEAYRQAAAAAKASPKPASQPAILSAPAAADPAPQAPGPP
jgi:hypothetical protein